MADELRENAQKSSFDHMMSLGEAALTVGVGAALFYRGGGKNILSRAGRISERFLQDVKNELSTLDTKNLTTKDLKDKFDKLVGDQNSSLQKAIEYAENAPLRLRVDNPNNIFGIIQQNYIRAVRDAEKFVKNEYMNQHVRFPASQKFVQEFAAEDKDLGRQIERFIFDVADHLNDSYTVDKIIKNHKLDKSLNKKQLDEMLDYMKQRLKDDKGYEQFKKDHQQAISEVIRKTLDPDEMERATGSRLNPTKQQKFEQFALGDRRLTVDDLLENAEKFEDNFVFDYATDSNNQGKSVIKEATRFLREFKDKIEKELGKGAAEKFGTLYVDPSLRIDKNGNIYSFGETSDFLQRFNDYFAGTMPGKILKLRDIGERVKAPSFHYTSASGSVADPLLSALTNKHNKKALTPESSFFTIYNRTYRFATDGLEHIEELDNAYFLSRYGTASRLVNQMFGNVDYRYADTKIAQMLDIGQDGSPTILDDIRSSIGKFDDPKWSKNIIKNFTNNPQELKTMLESYEKADKLSDEMIQNVYDVVDQIKNLNYFFSKNTYELNSEAVNKLMQKSDGEVKRLFNLLTLSNEDMLKQIIVSDSSSLRSVTDYLNQDLVSLLNKYVKTPKDARDMISIKTDRTDFFGGRETADFFSTLRMEIGKEAFMRHALNSSKDGKAYNFDAVSELIESAELSTKANRETIRLANWAAFQQAGNVNARSTKNKSVEALIEDSRQVVDMFLEPEDKTQQNAEFFRQFRESLKNMSKDKTSTFESSYSLFQESADIVTAYRQDDYIMMRKSISPLDVVKNLNDTEKLKAFFKQFVAGRNDPEHVTTATLAPYFMFVRLSDALSRVGLSFSATSIGSLGDLTKSMALKRGLPLVAGLTYFDYLSDMTGVVTGTTLKGAFASGIANIDLGMRRIADATGLTELLKVEKEINPLLSYWTGDEYMSYEERLDWYENGYEEMRKGRWWSFGGIQEFRGSEIAYYQPNYLRRITSDWKDVALYDSVWEKWSRSWLPTPTAPLSPIRYLINPYWLEEKHAEDRPYPMTAPMFTEQTPWGAILNPTIGEIIKPKRPMHQDRLDSNFVDVRALIEARNIEQFERAKDNVENHLVRFKEGIIEPVDYTTLAAPTPSQRVLQLQVDDGAVQNVTSESYQMFTGVMPAQMYLDASTSATVEGIRAGTSYVGGLGGGGFVLGGSGSGGLAVGEPQEVEGLSFRDELRIRAEAGEFLPEIADQILSRLDPTYDIEIINNNIKARAQAIGSRPNERGVVTPESIYRSQARFGAHILENEEAIADLRGLKGGDDFVGELAYASRFLFGIYGYGAFRMFPGEAYTKLEDAGKIDSVVRSFWDANLGGLGGGYGEIFRRFIPAFNHKVEYYNPLLNTMPDWLPERFRFGDPYTKIPKGEMRLPGEGYESLNELHPDMYGRYGAFDRFKILADIAPGTAEYKIWRDIASRTVTDPELRREMKEIRERVTEQSKTYDFYPYKFIGRSVDRQVAVVDEVLNNNYFTIMGSDRVFRLAGISVTGDQGQNLLSQYLVPGQEVVIATDSNPYNAVNEDSYNSVNAAIFINGQSLNRQLLQEGLATRRENDISAAAAQGMYTDFQILRGHIYEALSHAPIPYFSQKFFRIRDPLEHYKHEQIYGTPFASWNRPIDSFLIPGFERALMSDTEMAVGLGSLVMNSIVHNVSESKGMKTAANAALMLTNRGAFIGGFIGLAIHGGGKESRRYAQIGAAAQMLGWLYTRSDQPVEGTIGFGLLGGAIGHVIKDIGIKKGAIAGAATGLVLSGSQTSFLHEDLDKTWIPERTKEKWELQEYFDRLEYLKYSGLYEKAARRAFLFEGTDIKRLVNQYEKSKEEADKMREELLEYKNIIENIYPDGDTRAERMLAEIDAKLSAIKDTEMMMTVGKWGKAALIYKQAMDSTIYGLKEDASWAQLLRSLPANERDYFIEFAKVRDPEEREEILKYTSPYQRRALQIAWGLEPDEPESMASFFARHELPAPTWSGWRPNVDLDDVMVKTIENEGMLLSDFGFYESELRDPDVINAPNINPNDPERETVALRANLIAVLKGLGLTGVDVSVEPSTRQGIDVFVDAVKITQYNLKEKINNIFTF